MAQPMQMPRDPNRCWRCGEGLHPGHICAAHEPRALAQADRIVNAACPDVGEELPEPRRTETLYAFTPSGSYYPPYLNVRRSAVGGWYFITVRAAADNSGEYITTMPLDRTQLLELFKALAGELEVPVSRRI